MADDSSRRLRAGLLIAVAISVLAAGCATTGRDGSDISGEVDRARSAYEAGDYSRALPLLQRAAESGDATAQYALGYFYYEGLGVTGDLDTALVWFRRAARNGSNAAVEALTAIAAAGAKAAEDSGPGATAGPQSPDALGEGERSP